MAEKTHILPVFIPHLGCRHRCVFCNQYHVAGVTGLPDINEIIDMINKWEGETLPEIAFYGGNFTGLADEIQNRLLAPVAKALRDNRISGIRVSTRPDDISVHTVSTLAAYGVGLVELGVQSMDDTVLKLAGRGHTKSDVLRAIEILKQHQIKIGIQLMPGLPGDSPDKNRQGAFELTRLKPDLARIYPAVVLKDTRLHTLFMKGKFSPLTLEDAVAITRDMLAIFRRGNINVIRMGLQPTQEITEGAEIVAGPFHPAFGELVEAALARELIDYSIQRYFKNSSFAEITLFCNSRDTSIFAGHKRANVLYIKHAYSAKMVKIIGLNDVARGTLGISQFSDTPDLVVGEREFLEWYVSNMEF